MSTCTHRCQSRVSHCVPKRLWCFTSPSPLSPAPLQAAITESTEAVVLAEIMPAKWADFMRNAPMDTVRPLGTRSATKASNRFAQQLAQAPFGTQGGALQIPPPPPQQA